MTALLLLSSLAWAYVAWATWRMWARIPVLRRVAAEGERWPSVTVIAPSRNEEDAVEAATRSLLALDYPRLQVIAVDDRSEDATGAILDRLAESDHRLGVVHVRVLPPGWIGKNHANHAAALQSNSEWLLFTDGDVVFSPDSLRRAVALATSRDLGHLAAIPAIVAHGFWERAYQTAALMWVAVRFRVWELDRPRSAGYVGVGAFNLVRRADYLRVGGHEPVRMEVADDMKLGMLLRRAGTRQGLVDGSGCLSVRWLPGLRASLRSHAQKAMAVAEWRWHRALAVLALTAFLCVPPLLLLCGVTAAWPAVLASMATHGYTARRMASGSGLEGLTQPLMQALVLATFGFGCALTARQGGMYWRGTFYPMAALREGALMESDYPTDGVV